MPLRIRARSSFRVQWLARLASPVRNSDRFPRARFLSSGVSRGLLACSGSLRTQCATSKVTHYYSSSHSFARRKTILRARKTESKRSPFRACGCVSGREGPEFCLRPPRCVSTGPVVVRLAGMANERERERERESPETNERSSPFRARLLCVVSTHDTPRLDNGVASLQDEL